jgi:hypothetical protein
VTYVLDSSSFIVCGHYFPSRFPTFWVEFNALVQGGGIVSVREVRNELDHKANRQHLRDWIEENKAIFLVPTPQETRFVAQIFAVQHFQQLIAQKQRLTGWPVADPFVIACAHVGRACVVTEESFKPNAARIPNVCNHFGIDCISIEGMMERENWSF